jgi:mRNA interferase RelE/StbE
MAEISFTDEAVDDLRRIGPDAVPKVLKKVLLLAENAEAG